MIPPDAASHLSSKSLLPVAVFLELLQKLFTSPGSQYLHTGGCLPSHSQLVSTKLTAGRYSKVQLTKNRLHVLVDLTRNTTAPIPTSVFRDIICPLVPESVPLNCNFLFNIKYKIKKWLDKESQSSPSTKSILQLTEPPTALLVPNDLDFQPANFIQDASRYVRHLLQVSLKTGNNSVAIEHFLNSLSAQDHNFTFTINYDGVGSSCGFV